MSSPKRTEITVEIDRLLIVRRRHSTRLWCRECGREADFVAWEHVAKMEQFSRLLETGAKVAEPRSADDLRSFHTQETREETVLVCLESVLIFLTKSEITTRPKPKPK